MITRNDVDGAIRAFIFHCRNGTWTGDLARICLGLQDDPNELMRRFQETCAANPDIAKYVAEM